MTTPGEGKGERPARDYARLHRKWFADEVLEAVADEEPGAMVLWPVLIGMAKDASHHVDNPEGVVATTLARLAELTRLTRIYGEQANTRVWAALELLAEGDLAVVDVGKLGTVRVCLTRFAKWQTAQGSGAAKKQAKRDNEQGKSTAKSPVRPPDVPQTETETETNTPQSPPGVDAGPLADLAASLGVAVSGSPDSARRRSRRRHAGDQRSAAAARGINYDAGIEHVD